MSWLVAEKTIKYVEMRMEPCEAFYMPKRSGPAATVTTRHRDALVRKPHPVASLTHASGASNTRMAMPQLPRVQSVFCTSLRCPDCGSGWRPVQVITSGLPDKRSSHDVLASRKKDYLLARFLILGCTAAAGGAASPPGNSPANPSGSSSAAAGAISSSCCCCCCCCAGWPFTTAGLL
jgi:hypothetical protein